jgi:sarcosine oxidase subunit gamma
MLTSTSRFTSPLAHFLTPEFFGDPADLSLCDVSDLDRLLLKGPAAISFLAAQGIDIPDRLFSTSELPGDGIIIRTGTTEVLLEDGPEGNVCSSMGGALCYGGVYRAHAPTASMLLAGRRATDVLLETCNVDFREPSVNIVMTRVAGVSCSILYRVISGQSVFQLWFDGTYGPYLGSTLLGIVQEHIGVVAG